MGRGLIERLDDRLNPIVVKELRQAVRSRSVVSVLMGFLVLQALIVGFTLVFQEQTPHAGRIDFYAGRQIFQALQAILLGTCMLLVPAYAGMRLAAERSDANVDLLFISALRPRTILVGKTLAALVLVLLVFSACAPFMTFTYLLRGIDIPTILVVLAIDFLAVLVATQVTLFLAAVPANRGLRALIGMGGLGALGNVFGLTVAGTITLVEMGGGLPMDSWLFWGPAGSAVILALLGMGLFFCWSVALLNPPSANRALPVRLYLVAVWLLTGVLAGLWCYYTRVAWFLFGWMLVNVLLFGVHLVVAINERDQWGTRVTRTIPRRAWLRPAAFLFYSGAAGGVVFAVLMLVLTVTLASLVPHWGKSFFYDPLRGMGEMFSFRAGVLLMALYTLCYCLTALFVRVVLLRGLLPGLYTWVVVVVLVALGTVLPSLCDYLFFQGEMYRDPDGIYWQLTNPFVMVSRVIFQRLMILSPNLDTVCMAFTGGWATLMTLSLLPWFVRQVRAFRPSGAQGRAV